MQDIGEPGSTFTLEQVKQQVGLWREHKTGGAAASYRGLNPTASANYF